MDTPQKIFKIALYTTLFSTTFLYPEETAKTTSAKESHEPFKPNKRHMHEKKEVKKEATQKKSHSKAARIHKKEEKSGAVKKNTEKENPFIHHVSSIRHHEQKQLETQSPSSAINHHTNIARHHKKEPTLKKANKDNIFQKTWGKIKSFFSSKKTT